MSSKFKEPGDHYSNDKDFLELELKCRDLHSYNPMRRRGLYHR